MEIIRHPVVSEHIEGIGYDLPSKTLEVAYKTGAIFQYKGVPELEYEKLISSPVKDLYMDTHIRKNYEYQMIQPSRM